MAKTNGNTGATGATETIADKIAREQAEKATGATGDASQEPSGAEQATTQAAPEEEKVDPEFEAALNEPDTSTEADVAAALKQDDDEQALQDAVSGADARTRSMEAAKKLRIIALDFHPSSPDSHVVFGRAVQRFTLGDLRDLVGLPRVS